MERPLYGTRKLSRKAAEEQAGDTLVSRPRVALAGWGLLVGGALCLVWWAEPQWRATFGDGFLTYRPHPPSAVRVGGWAPVFAIMGPMVALNVVFFATDKARRRRVFSLVVALIAAEIVFVLAAALWAVGADLPSGIVFDADGSSDVFVPLVFVPGVCLAAAALMGYASEPGTVRPRVGLRAKVLLLLTFAALWLLFLVPAWLASDHALHWGGSDSSRPWPRPWTGADDLESLTVTLYVFTSVPLGITLSAVLKEILYSTVLRAHTDGSAERPRTSRGRTLVRSLQHAPMVLAVLFCSIALGSGVPAHHAGTGSGGVAPLLTIAAVVAVAACVLIANIWRVHDLSDPALRGSRAVPSRRRSRGGSD